MESHPKPIEILKTPEIGLVFGLGNATKCKGITDKVSRGEMVLDSATLMTANGNMQHVVDCAPPGTKVVVRVDEIPMARGLIIDKPMSIISDQTSVRLQCSMAGIKIR